MSKEYAGSTSAVAEVLAAVKRLRRRARTLRAERSAAFGLAVGLGLGVLLRIAELAHLLQPASWWYVIAAILPAACAWLWAFLHPPDLLAVAAAADRALGTKDRAASAVALRQLHDPMTAALAEDASSHLSGAEPRRVFARRAAGRIWPPAAAGAALALAIFLPQWPALQSAQARAERAELKAKAEQVERLAADIEKRADAETEDIAHQVAENLRRLGRNLKSPGMTRRRALERMKDTAQQLADAKAKIEADSPKKLAQVGDELSQLAARAAAAQQKQRMRDLRELSELKQAGLGDIETLEQLAEVEATDLQAFKDLPQLKGLTQEQIRRLAELARRARSRQLHHNLDMPQDLLDALSELFAKEDYLAALELMQALFDKLQDRLEAQQAGEAPELTDEELKRLQEELEKLAALLKDTNLDELAKKLRELAEGLSRMDIEELLKLLEQCKGCCGNCCGVGLGLLPGLSAAMGACGGCLGIGPGDSMGRWRPGALDVPRGDPERIQVPLGDVNIQGQFGDEGEVAATEVYVPPSASGEEGKVPYFRVLPSYREQAEDALRREEVPPEHRERVKRYFESLTSQ